MAVTTFLERIDTIQDHLSCIPLTELLRDLKQATQEEWLIREKSFGVFRKINKYQLLIHLGESEYQIINLYSSNTKEPLVYWYSAESVAGYILGYLAGLA